MAERANGTRVAFTAHSAPIFDGTGQISGTVNALVATRELERSEADSQQTNARLEGRPHGITEMAGKLKESERTFRMLVESVIDYAIFMLDRRDMSQTGTQERKGSKAIRGLKSSGNTFLASIRKKIG